MLFNFNKSCIWIASQTNKRVYYCNYLTLTRVVFECEAITAAGDTINNLTLTRVVFELHINRNKK